MVPGTVGSFCCCLLAVLVVVVVVDGCLSSVMVHYETTTTPCLRVFLDFSCYIISPPTRLTGVAYMLAKAPKRSLTNIFDDDEAHTTF